MELEWIFKEFGPVIGFLAFYIYRDMTREKKLSDRITELERQQTEVILPLVTQTTEVLARNTVVMERNTQVIGRLETFLQK